MELLWACLLALACLDRRTRPLAFLMACKWATNYAAFGLAQWSPALVDVAFGAVGIMWAARVRARWADIVTAGFVLTPLAHAWFWMLWEAGDTATFPPALYFVVVVSIYTAQVSALAWPEVSDLVRRFLRLLDIYRRSFLADAARRSDSIDREGSPD